MYYNSIIMNRKFNYYKPSQAKPSQAKPSQYFKLFQILCLLNNYKILFYLCIKTLFKLFFEFIKLCIEKSIYLFKFFYKYLSIKNNRFNDFLSKIYFNLKSRRYYYANFL